MKGTAVKSTGNGGWLEEYTWNKHNVNSWGDICGYTGLTGDVYYITPYHDSNNQDGFDFIGIVSEDGFKNTGLKNGVNHLKCWFKGAMGNDMFFGSDYYNSDWTPDFEADDGQSLIGWASTGSAFEIDLKNSHKRVPYNDVCGWDYS